MFHDYVNKSFEKWFIAIEKELRVMKNATHPLLSDKEFAELVVVDFNFDGDVPCAVIRWKTVDEFVGNMSERDRYTGFVFNGKGYVKYCGKTIIKFDFFLGDDEKAKKCIDACLDVLNNFDGR